LNDASFPQSSLPPRNGYSSGTKNILSTTLSSVRANGFVVVSDILNRTVGLAEVQRLASKLDFVEVHEKKVVVNGSCVVLVTILVKEAKSSADIASLLSGEGMTRRAKQVTLDLGDSNRSGLSRLSSTTPSNNTTVTVSHDHKTTKAERPLWCMRSPSLTPTVATSLSTSGRPTPGLVLCNTLLAKAIHQSRRRSAI
jgi:hypothetical protein